MIGANQTNNQVKANNMNKLIDQSLFTNVGINGNQ